MTTQNLSLVAYRGFVAVALASIAYSLIEIKKNMPPRASTLAEYQAATPEEKKKLIAGLPLVRVSGIVDVGNTVDVNVENGPLRVMIER